VVGLVGWEVMGGDGGVGRDFWKGVRIIGEGVFDD